MFVDDRLKVSCFKTFILLYSCCSSQAVHLEVEAKFDCRIVSSRSENVRSRRSIPNFTLSYNAKTFQKSTLIAKKILETFESSKFAMFFLLIRLF